jgi:hypothetical protein
LKIKWKNKGKIIYFKYVGGSMSIGTTLDLKNLNNLAGGLASSAVSFAFTGNATFNILNLTDFGTRINIGLIFSKFWKDEIGIIIQDYFLNMRYDK